MPISPISSMNSDRRVNAGRRPGRYSPAVDRGRSRCAAASALTSAVGHTLRNADA